jgi:hypothetical protein
MQAQRVQQSEPIPFDVLQNARLPRTNVQQCEANQQQPVQEAHLSETGTSEG